MGDKIWTFWGKVKQVFSQLSIYFSVLSMIGIAVTAWHTTISPILESYNITPPTWLILTALGVLFIALWLFEWKKGINGFYRSFTQLFYTEDSQLKKDIVELRREILELKELLKK